MRVLKNVEVLCVALRSSPRCADSISRGSLWNAGASSLRLISAWWAIVHVVDRASALLHVSPKTIYKCGRPDCRSGLPLVLDKNSKIHCVVCAGCRTLRGKGAPTQGRTRFVYEGLHARAGVQDGSCESKDLGSSCLACSGLTSITPVLAEVAERRRNNCAGRDQSQQAQ